MKKILSTLLIISLVYFNSMSQKRDSSLSILPSPYLLPIAKKAIRGSYPIELSFFKTTHIIFPSKIRDFDAGSSDVMAILPNGINNVLRVKSANKGFTEETNMTVLTDDGGYYSFIVNYNDNPEIFNINIANNVAMDQKITDSLGIGRGALNTKNSYLFNPGVINEDDTKKDALKAYKSIKFIRHIGAKKSQLSFTLKGIYYKDKQMFFQVSIENSSSLDYEIDFIKVFVRDQEILKSTAYQEDEIKILYQYPESNTLVESNSTHKRIIAIPFVTLSDGKILEFELYEKDGGRHLKFQLSNDTITQAKSL